MDQFGVSPTLKKTRARRMRRWAAMSLGFLKSRAVLKTAGLPFVTSSSVHPGSVHSLGSPRSSAVVCRRRWAWLSLGRHSSPIGAPTLASRVLFSRARSPLGGLTAVIQPGATPNGIGFGGAGNRPYLHRRSGSRTSESAARSGVSAPTKVSQTLALKSSSANH